MAKVRRIYIVAPTFNEALYHFNQFCEDPRVWLSTLRRSRTEIETHTHVIAAQPLAACKGLRGTFVYFGPSCPEWLQLRGQIM